MVTEVAKLFNIISIVGGILGGFLSGLLGGYDAMLKALIALVILDYITGILKGIATKTLSSSVGFKGLIRKIIIFIIVATAVIIQGVIGDSIPLRDITIVFYICNESISLLENGAEFVPLPKKLKDTLIQIRDKEVNGNE